MKSYICVGAIVKNRFRQIGRVIEVNQNHKLALVRIGNFTSVEKTTDLEVLSYREVM